MSESHQRSFSSGMYSIVIAVVIIAAAGLVAMMRFNEIETARDMREWQTKLGLIADSRAANVQEWVGRHFSELTGLADNASLQLYVTELETLQTTPNPVYEEDASQKVFLRNLLILTAERGGFSAPNSEVSQIQANIQPLAEGGIAILNEQGDFLVGTSGVPPLNTVRMAQVLGVPKSESALIDMWQETDGKRYIGFVVPLYAIQGDENASSQIGRIVGVKRVTAELYDVLKHPGIIETSLEISLLRAEGEMVRYLTPLSDESKPMQKTLRMEDGLAGAYVLSSPGGFDTKRDYAFRPVLVTGRTIAGTGWVLMVKIDTQEALAESAAWREQLLTIFVLSLIAVIGAIIAAWWYGASKEAKLLAARAESMAQKFKAQEHLLRLVSDTQPDPVFILDHDYRYRFANAKAGEVAELDHEQLLGKDIADVLGPARAKTYIDQASACLKEGGEKTLTHSIERANETRMMVSDFIALEHIPIRNIPEPTPGVLVVEQDVTQVMQERERRLGVLKQLIATLVHMVDARDPYAANHSQMVAFISKEVAQEMGLETTLVETAETAGTLMNIGKMVVSADVLTKAGHLDASEKESVRHSMRQSASLLKEISFNGPVVETLHQAQEHYDGSGADGIVGEDILITARIISVVNAFVSMISPRAYREAISLDEACKELLANVDLLYDRRVVASLISYLENHGGRESLQGMLSLAKAG